MKKLILAVMMTLIYCSENSINSENNIDLIENFYDTQGNQWIYAYYDSLTQAEDTVTVSVLGTLNDSDTTLWQYIFSTHTDTQYVWFRNDTLTSGSLTSHSMREMILVFPFEVGNGWRGYYATDTFSVAARDTLFVPAGEFENAWLIEENWGAFNDYGKIKIWIDPDVGMIYKHHLGWSFGTANNTWKLLSYKIMHDKANHAQN